MERPFGESSVDAVTSPIAGASRVEQKGRKRKAIPDTGWRDILLENLERAGVNPTETIKDVSEAKAAAQEPETHPEHHAGNGISIDTEAEFEEMLMEIKRMADEPEKLVESHLGVFTDPAPPGKLLNSQG